MDLASAQDHAKSEGRTCRLGSPCDESQGRALRIGPECTISLCTAHVDHASHGRPRGCGPPANVKEVTGDMETTTLLRDVQFLKPGKPPVKFMGWTVDGFRLINPQLIEDIVQDSGLASSTKKCATAGVKDWVVDETPLDKEEHSYFRTQVGRLLFLSAPRPDLPHVVGQLARHASAPTVSDRIAMKHFIRFLSATRDTKLELFPKGRLVLSTVADADWAGLTERRSVTKVWCCWRDVVRQAGRGL